MDKNHQDKTRSKLTATEDQLWLPPLSPKGQDKLKQLRKKSFGVRMGFVGKTPWDLAQLLLIPLMLLVVGSWFSYQQNQTSFQLGQQQHSSDQQIALEQQREMVLEAYLDHISGLLLDNNLRKSKLGDEIQEVARAETLITLPRLDPVRKGTLLRFLYESGLIYRSNVIVNLWGANLSETDMAIKSSTQISSVIFATSLAYAELNGADLSRADLRYTDLSGIDLAHSTLIDTDLGKNALLREADLNDATLYGANLSGADLSYANLKGATGITVDELKKQAKSLQGTIMPDGSIHP